MARKKVNYTIVYIEDSKLVTIRCGDDVTDAKLELAKLPEEAQATLFDSEPIPFSIGIVIGKAATAPARKKAPGRKPKAAASPNGHRVDTDFFDDGPTATNPLDKE